MQEKNIKYNTRKSAVFVVWSHYLSLFEKKKKMIEAATDSD